MSSPASARSADGRFLPGASGNAGGRPVIVRKVRDLAQSHAPQAMEELARLAFSAEDERVRVAAIRELLDRAVGKADRPSQALASVSLAQVLQNMADRSAAQNEVIASLRAGMDARLIEHDQAANPIEE